MSIADTIDGARRAFETTGRGCLVRMGEDEPRHATVWEIAARLELHGDATMLVTAVSEAVGRYDPATEAVILLETDSGFQLFILSPFEWESVGVCSWAHPKRRSPPLRPRETAEVKGIYNQLFMTFHKARDDFRIASLLAGVGFS